MKIFILLFVLLISTSCTKADAVKECSQDSDCIEAHDPCSCCIYIAVPKNKASELSESKCKESPPPCACERVHNTAVCKVGKCELIRGTSKK